MTVDRAALQTQHLDGHGQGRHCMGPSVCSSVRYLAIIEQLVVERDTWQELAEEQQGQNDRLQRLGIQTILLNRAILSIRDWSRQVVDGLTETRDHARDLAAALENRVAELTDEAAKLRAEMVEQAEERMEAERKHHGEVARLRADIAGSEALCTRLRDQQERLYARLDEQGVPL